MTLGNIFELIPEKLDEELVGVLLKNENVTIERIVSKGHASPATGWYDQEQNEWAVVVKGEAVLSFENGREETLTAGSYINIPAHTKHKVKWTHPTIETVWLAIYY